MPDEPARPKTAPTFTILSTIAIHSGPNRMVIALLQSENCLQLQIIECEPDVSELPTSVDDAIAAHDTHLRFLDQLKKCGSPVDELVCKAEQLRGSDTVDRTVVLAKMTANLTDAWNDIQNLLQKRKDMLESNVQYRKLMCEYFQSVDDLQTRALDDANENRASHADVEFAKQHLDEMTANRKLVMQKLFQVLRYGNELVSLVNDLKRFATAVDCRPEQDLCNRIQKTLDEIEKSFESVSRKRKQFEDFYRLEKLKSDRFLHVLSNAKTIADFERDFDKLDGEIAENRQNFTLESQERFRNENERQLQTLLKLREKTVRFTYSLEQQQQQRKQLENLQARTDANVDVVKAYELLDRLNCSIALLQKFGTMLAACVDFLAAKHEVVERKLVEFENEVNASKNRDDGDDGDDEAETKLANLKSELIIGHLECGKALIGSLEKMNLPAGLGERIEAGLERAARKVYEFDLYFEARNADRARNRADSELLHKFGETLREIDLQLAGVEALIRGRRSQLGPTLPAAKSLRIASSDNLRHLQTIGTEINRLLNALLTARLSREPERLQSVSATIERLRSRWVAVKNEAERRLDLAGSLIAFYTQTAEWLRHGDASAVAERQAALADLTRLADDLVASTENYARDFAIDEQIDSLDAVKSIREQLAAKNSDELLQRDLCTRWDRIMEESLMIVNVATKLRNQLYPVVDFEFGTLSDLINELKRKSTKMLPELDKILHEIDTKIHDTEQLSLKSEHIAQQSQTITRKLRDLRQSLGSIIDEYNQLIRETIDFFVNLQEFDRKLEFESGSSPLPAKAAAAAALAALAAPASGTSSAKLTANLAELEQVHDTLIRKIQQTETSEPAVERDTNVLIAIFQEQKLHLKEVLAKRQKEFDAKQDAILFESNLQGIYKALDQLTDQLNDIRADLGDSRESVHKNCRLFQTFEKTTEILNTKIYQLCNEDVLIDDNVRNAKLFKLNERLERFEVDVQVIKDLLHKSLYYYDLIEKAETWIENGTELLNEIADKSSLICSVEEAQILRNEIEKFLQVDERQQNERINEISKLSFELFKRSDDPEAAENGEKNSAQQLIAKNKNFFTSFARVENELSALAAQFEAYRNGDENVRRKFTMRLPEFEKPLTNVLIGLGDTLRLQCVVRGEPEPFIKWLFNGEPVSDSDANVRIRNEAGRQELVRERVTKEHEGYYTIHARNRMGDVNSSCNVYVRGECSSDEVDASGEREPEEAVAAPVCERRPEKHPIRPKIQSALKDQQVRLGEQAVLECVIVCEPEPEVIWYHDSSLVKESANIKLQFRGDQCSLIIKSTVAEDSGCYRVVAINAAGEASSQCSLTVAEHDFQPARTVKNVTETLPIEPVPILKRKLENCRVVDGETVVLACEATNVDNCKWFRNHHQIAADSSKYRLGHDRQSGRVWLEIRECRANDDAGEYTVYLANRVGQVHCTANVQVEPEVVGAMTTVADEKTAVAAAAAAPAKVQPPKIINGLVGRICEQGVDSTQFECIYHVYPANSVEIDWHRNNTRIEAAAENFSILNFPNKSILKVSNVTHQMAGRYTCTIRNAAGSQSSTADLVVKKTTFPPVIGRRLKDREILAGDRVQMEIEVTGTPKPDVAWFKDGAPIAESLAPNDFQLKCHGNHCELVIFAAKFEHMGEYSAKVTNSVGEAFSSAKIMILEAPQEQQQEEKPEPEPQQQQQLQQPHLQKISESCFVQKLFYESQEVEKTHLEPNHEPPAAAAAAAAATDFAVQATSSSAKAFEESRLYFLEKLSQNRQQPPEVPKRKPLKYSSSFKLESETSRKRFETSTKSVSPRPEALEMEKLWASSGAVGRPASRARLVDSGYGHYEKSATDHYNVVYESRNPFLCNSNDTVTAPLPEPVVPAAPAAPSEPEPKPDPINFVRSQSESGYIADTEEQHKESRRNFRTCFDTRFRSNECASSRTNQTLSVDEEKQTVVKVQSRRAAAVTNASPSKFVVQKHTIESDYENESLARPRMAVVWSPAAVPDDGRPQPSYRPVRTDFVKSQARVALPPAPLQPPQAPSRPKFEPIVKPPPPPPPPQSFDHGAAETIANQAQILYKPKAVSVKSQILYRSENEIVLKPGSPPQLLFSDSRPGSCCNEIAETPTTPVFYRATAATVRETTTAASRQFSANFRESNEFFEQNHLYCANKQTNEIKHSNSYRKIDTEPKTLATKPRPAYPQQQQQQHEQQPNRSMPSQLPQRVKKPRKFVPGEPRESDYESELESVRIKPLWNPKEVGTNEPCYRPVKVPVVVGASYKQRPSAATAAPPAAHNRIVPVRKTDSCNRSLRGEPKNELLQKDSGWLAALKTSRRPHDYPNATPPSSARTTPLHFVPPTKNPPYFITPLRDIAVLCGRTARFECIVQSDQTPFVSWSTNGRVLNPCRKYDIYYRNGVCRLTISNVTFNDSGTFLCTATNQLGSVNTSGSLQVNNDKRLTFVY